MRRRLLLLPALLMIGCGNQPSLMPSSPSAIPVTAAASPVTYTLEGIVSTTTASGSRAIDGARITVATPTGWLEATTDNQGRYRLTGVAPVICEIIVTKEGFAPLHATAELTRDTVMNFELRGM